MLVFALQFPLAGDMARFAECGVSMREGPKGGHFLKGCNER